MADWNSLKPLKVHSTFMTIVVLALAGILILTPTHKFRAQASAFYHQRNYASVNAKGGLSIRSEPSIRGALLTSVPYQAVLTIVDEKAASDVINGKSGQWYKVQYNGNTGFAWGNYIDK